MDERERRRLSKKLAVALRHRPEAFGIVLDPGGWTSTRRLVAGLRERGGPRYAHVGQDDLAAVVANQDKPRYELSQDGTRIRALYGHSVPHVTPSTEPRVPPEVLLHGTSRSAAQAILRDGLRPMSRQWVHLSEDPQTAEQVGRRHARRDDPIEILQVQAAAAHEAGIAFHRPAPGIWLAAPIPPGFITTPR